MQEHNGTNASRQHKELQRGVLEILYSDVNIQQPDWNAVTPLTIPVHQDMRQYKKEEEPGERN